MVMVKDEEIFHPKDATLKFMEILPDSPKDPLSTLQHTKDGEREKSGDSFSITPYHANSFMLEVGCWRVRGDSGQQNS